MVKRLSLFLLFLMLVVGISVWYKSESGPASPKPPAAQPTPQLPKVVEVIAPDTKKTVVMEERKFQGSITHIFSTFAEKGDLPKQIFTRTLYFPQTVAIPFNTWSPDNKYLFLKETEGGEDSYIVMTSSGNAIRENYQIVNVGERFYEKYAQDYKITDVTGWAAPTLLLVNTDKVDGTVGPSFWFDVSSLSFIRLSTRFN